MRCPGELVRPTSWSEMMGWQRVHRIKSSMKGGGNLCPMSKASPRVTNDLAIKLGGSFNCWVFG